MKIAAATAGAGKVATAGATSPAHLNDEPRGASGPFSALLLGASAIPLRLLQGAIQGAVEARPEPSVRRLDDGSLVDQSGVRIDGSEAPFEPELWNHPLYVLFNNCYAYAVNHLLDSRQAKPQPGDRAGRANDWLTTTIDPDNPRVADTDINTGRLRRAIGADQQAVFLGMNPENTLRAPRGATIVALVIDDQDGIEDYHWYRHHKDGTWSHKPGAGLATNLDASNNLILDPRTADRNYGPRTFQLEGPQGTRVEISGVLNYNRWGGYYAVMPGAAVGPEARPPERSRR
jgi:hypothetical protein